MIRFKLRHQQRHKYIDLISFKNKTTCGNSTHIIFKYLYNYDFFNLDIDIDIDILI